MTAHATVPVLPSPPSLLSVFVLLPCCRRPHPRHHPLDPFSDNHGRSFDGVVRSLRYCCHSPAMQGKGGTQVARERPAAVEAPVVEGTKMGTKVGCLFRWRVLTCVNREHLSEDDRVPPNSVDSRYELDSKWRDNLSLNSLNQTLHVVCRK